MSAQPRLMSSLRTRRILSWKAVLAFAVATMAAWMSPGTFTEGLGTSAYAIQESGGVAAVEDNSAEPDSTNRDSANHGDGAHDNGGHENGSHENGGHTDPVAEVLLAILIILLLAKISGDIFERTGMPAVLGELTVGMILGNWEFITGSPVFNFFKPHPEDAHAMTGNVLDMLSRIGVVLLLFEVGLESRVKEMASVGVSSLLVAILGVVVPMALGFGIGYAIVSQSASEWQIPAFLGATLCATSVGITARVLKDLGKSKARESKIILGAAVIDDVLGLVVLAVVSGVIQEGADFQILSLFKIVGLSFAFLATALIVGALQLPRLLFTAASFLRGHGLLVATALVICFLFSWGANQVGLAPIIGAFAAGLILEGAHYREAGEKWKNHQLEDALAPLTALLVPIFFVSTGISVDFNTFVESPAAAVAAASDDTDPVVQPESEATDSDPSVSPDELTTPAAVSGPPSHVSGGTLWLLAFGLTIAAILGKLVCVFGVREKGLNKLSVGLGMIPRGEVGLIFAGVGRELTTPNGESVIDTGTFSAIVVMVMVTTMITPPLLKWAMGDDTAAPDADDSAEGTGSENSR